jgi:indolepyruvate ferredoxin oxidoreductase alpha subunit
MEKKWYSVSIMSETHALLGDEAVALGAIQAGLSAAYGYPGTPSTEIMEYIQGYAEGHPDAALVAEWCSNEKTSLEAALGCSFAGKRAIVTCKHVGVNVMADPLLNSASLAIKGGLVIAVADDPSMHSSQGEQDSRFYASFALIPCLEPRSQQEAYDMAREAFDLSEKFQVPVMLRLVTRLSHARATIREHAGREQNKLDKCTDKKAWMLLPATARVNYTRLIGKQEALEDWAGREVYTKLKVCGNTKADSVPVDREFAVITSGLGGNYYDENLPDLKAKLGGKVPARLHIAAYPLPVELIRKLCEKAKRVLVIEEGQPFIEQRLRGILPQNIQVIGRLNREAELQGHLLPRTGELDPDNVRPALGLPPRKNVLSANRAEASASAEASAYLKDLPGRPPQLCQGCPHADSFMTIKQVRDELLLGVPESEKANTVAITSDIGCYSLGAQPPYGVPETIVCMGASIGMAHGASEAGVKYTAAVIGDSTFLHSGITGLVDAVASKANMTVIILDNSIVAMTGCQPTIIPSSSLKPLILGCGVESAHYVELEALKQKQAENAAKLKAEMQYKGLSVVVFRRECLEAARKRKAKERSKHEV